MQMPDLELFHKLKCKLDDRLEAFPASRSDLQRAAMNHMRKTIARAQQQMDKAVSDAIDDLYYINEALDSEGDTKNENQLPESSTL